jgi:beta-N-acetylhexosaminidase
MLKEKIGQMLILGFRGMRLEPEAAMAKAIRDKQVGGVILFDYDFPTKSYMHNIESPAQIKRLTQDLSTYARQHSLPLLISIDYEGGKVNRLKEKYGFPHTESAATLATYSPEKMIAAAKLMARTLAEAGINMNFAPDVDLNLNPNNPIIGRLERSFSADPQRVADCALIFAHAYQEQGILSVYKHFPGHGSSKADTHLGFVDITHSWQEIELQPFRNLQQHLACPIIMTGHLLHKGLDPAGYPASLSQAITTQLLRHTLGFDGVIVTDDLQMKAVTDHYGFAEAMQLAINAGADLLIIGNQLGAEREAAELIDWILQAVKKGQIKESRIDEAYGRIVQLKRFFR